MSYQIAPQDAEGTVKCCSWILAPVWFQVLFVPGCAAVPFLRLGFTGFGLLVVLVLACAGLGFGLPLACPFPSPCL